MPSCFGGRVDGRPFGNVTIAIDGQLMSFCHTGLNCTKFKQVLYLRVLCLYV